LGGIYENDNGDRVDTLEKAIKMLTPDLKDFHHRKRIKVVQHTIPVSSLGFLKHITYLTLKDLLNCKPKRIINIWEKDW
jgi:hypothetical protein